MARAVVTNGGRNAVHANQIVGWPRPEERDDWYGDPTIERAMLDAYRGGRMHHAWLIGGPKGIGKATLAYRFARFVLAHPDPDDAEVADASDLAIVADRPSFGKVAARSHPNLLPLERPYDAEKKRFRAALTVPEIRRTIPFFGSTSGEPGWRIAIVDSADDMNASAANALLKILEEPPARSLLLIVSHAPGRLLATIRSRCRRLDVPPLARTTIRTALSQNSTTEAVDLDLAAALAEGSLRRAIYLLEAGGIDSYRRLTRLLGQLPNIDVAELHDFADGVAKRGDDDAWIGFVDIMRGWLNRRVRGEDEPDSRAAIAPAAGRAPLESWAEVWENLRRLSALTDTLNLDRKRAVLSIVMSLARAARM